MTDIGGANPRESWRRFGACFPGRNHVFLPVIYTVDQKQALRNVDVAREADADGVFLINHGISHRPLLQIVQKVVEAHPGLFVGVNCLDLRPPEVIRRLPRGVQAVWTNEPPTLDAAGETAVAIRQARQATGWDGMFFATVPPPAKVSWANALADTVAAAAYIDVPTIIEQHLEEGDIQVLRAVSRALGLRPLAIAATVHSGSVEGLLHHANCVMSSACASNGLEQRDLQEARLLASKTHAS